MAIDFRKVTKKPLIAVTGVVVLMVAVALVWALKDTPNKGSGVIPSTSPSKTVATSADKQNVTVSGSASSSSSAQPAKTPGSSTATLEAPSGTFVSNHRPNLSGSPTPSQEQSVCNTTPGATCYLQFVKDGVTKTLSEQTTDSLGAAYWTWDVKQSGFTIGSWQVTAIASLNGQVKTTKDSLSLEVQP